MTILIYEFHIILQGGEPDFSTVAKMVLNDFQRGKIPYFVKPPGMDVRFNFTCTVVAGVQFNHLLSPLQRSCEGI